MLAQISARSIDRLPVPRPLSTFKKKITSTNINTHTLTGPLILYVWSDFLWSLSLIITHTHTHKWNASNLYTAKKEKFEPSSSSSYCSIQIYFFILFFGSIFSLVNFFFFSPSHNQYIQKEKEKETNSKSINQSISPLSTESMI